MTNVQAVQDLRVFTEHQEYSLDCQERTPPVGSNGQTAALGQTENI